MKIASINKLSHWLSLAATACAAALVPTVHADTLVQLNAPQITSAMGAGWNLGNQLEANLNGTPNETAWSNPTITPSLIRAVKAAGFKTIRIPVSYLSYIGSGPNYTINATWLARVKQVVDYAYSEGLYVIINIHGDGYNSIQGGWLLCNGSDQTTIRAKYQKVWQQLATTFINYDHRLIFESMNEVFDGVTYGPPVNQTYYSNINTYNQIFVNTVRQTGGNNGSRWLLIPGWNTDINLTAGNYGFALPTDNYRSSAVPSAEKRIMISVHYYTPWDFCGDTSSWITQWGATATDPSRTTSWGGQEDYLDAQFKLMRDRFVSQGYPFVVGEYGSINKTYRDSTNMTYRIAYAKAVCANARKYGGVPVLWDEGHTGNDAFGVINRSNYTVTHQGIVNAIMNAIGDDGGAIQAESATPSGGVTFETNNAGFNGTGFANFPASGGMLTFSKVSGNGGGTKALAIRYANGGTTARTGTITVNGVIWSITFNPTGSWTTWQTMNVTVTLNDSTSNTIQLASNGQDLGNIDQILVPPTQSTPDTYQAENAVAAGGVTFDNNNAGFTGTGFANFPTTGGTLTFNNVDGNGGGAKSLAIRYANGGTSSRTGTITVNGSTWNIAYSPTGGWSTWSTLTVNITLNNTTTNTIRLASSGQDLGNVDQITVP